jgi:hypothetical protein
MRPARKVRASGWRMEAGMEREFERGSQRGGVEALACSTSGTAEDKVGRSGRAVCRAEAWAGQSGLEAVGSRAIAYPLPAHRAGPPAAPPGEATAAGGPNRLRQNRSPRITEGESGSFSTRAGYLRLNIRFSSGANSRNRLKALLMPSSMPALRIAVEGSRYPAGIHRLPVN